MKKLTALVTVLVVLAGAALISCKKTADSTPNTDAILQMKAVTDSLVKNTHVPGIVALVVDRNRGIDWLYTAGYADVPNKTPMESGLVFRIASITKTFTVTVLLQLADEGKIHLNDRLSLYFPLYPKADSITLEMLCKMTSGIHNYLNDSIFQATKISDPGRVWLPQELISLGFNHPFLFSPGSSWSYSNTNTYIVGRIIEQVTGHSLEWEIQHRILVPLGLVNTGFITSGKTFPGPHPRGYCWGPFKENDDLTEYYDMSMAWAAGSAYSTIRELQKYVETVVRGGLMSDSLQHRRMTDMHILSPTTGYGLGLFHRGTFFGHNGGAPGFTASMYHSIDKNCTVIIFFNCNLEQQPDLLFFRFMDILYGSSY